MILISVFFFKKCAENLITTMFLKAVKQNMHYSNLMMLQVIESEGDGHGQANG